MNPRTTVAATALALSLFAIAACSHVPGTAAAASAVPTTSITTTSIATVTVSSPTTSSPMVRPSPEDSPATTSGVESGGADTTAWVEGICTGVGAVLDELVEEKPQLADDVSVGQLRQAMIDYYALSTRTVDTAATDATGLKPPSVANGRSIHEAYQHFLSGLGDIFATAALDMSGAADLAEVETVNNAVDEHITTLGSDNAALQAMSSGELADIASTIPAWKAVSDTANGS